MLIIFIIATLITISLIVQRDKGSVIGLILWLVTIAVRLLSSYTQLDYLIIALGTVWTLLLLVWLYRINIRKEEN